MLNSFALSLTCVKMGTIKPTKKEDDVVFELLFLYLYFPEDKTEYIPVVLQLVGVLILAALVIRWLLKRSAIEAEQARQLEERLKAEKEQEQSN